MNAIEIICTKKKGKEKIKTKLESMTERSNEYLQYSLKEPDESVCRGKDDGSVFARICKYVKCIIGCRYGKIRKTGKGKWRKARSLSDYSGD